IQGQPKPGKPFPVVRPETFDSVLVFCPFLSGLPCLADTLLSNRKLRNKPVPGPGDRKGRPYILCGHRLDNRCIPHPLRGCAGAFFPPPLVVYCLLLTYCWCFLTLYVPISMPKKEDRWERQD